MNVVSPYKKVTCNLCCDGPTDGIAISVSTDAVTFEVNVCLECCSQVRQRSRARSVSRCARSWRISSRPDSRN